ncbi:sce7726 family protein [Shewanella litorisediminis]|uniref:Sce7726 family protein n=1 Tax=Shewanella litorisediminis TaxID=1173586 RepID=A0ABX7G2J0_9GAMM|nr:sce7726 family protein [Shewanella litorisediminis]MCL2917040.1 sce7726 family protein [Shewanella litorisediminis]QRH01521.1 sce7726 family protein [Shewanella litorisediminis]
MTEFQIKKRLIGYLLENNPSILLACELRFLDGRRRADVALIDNNLASGFEIKSENDSIDSLNEQLEDYKKYFDYVSVVCEKSNIAAIRNKINKNYGIILVTENSIKAIRKPKHFKLLSKRALLNSMDLTNLKEFDSYSKLSSKSKIIDILERKHSLSKIKEMSRTDLMKKLEYKNKLFQSEKMEEIFHEDILTLTRASPQKLS